MHQNSNLCIILIDPQLCIIGSTVVVILLIIYVWEDHGYCIAGQLFVRGSWLLYCWSVMCERIMAMILLVSCLWEDHGCDIAGQLLVKGGWGQQCCWWELLVKEWPLYLYFWSDFSCEVIIAVISLKDSYCWSELLVNKGLASSSQGTCILVCPVTMHVSVCVHSHLFSACIPAHVSLTLSD